MTLNDIAIIAIAVASILNAVNIMLILKRLDMLEFGNAWILMRTGLDKQLEREAKERMTDD